MTESNRLTLWQDWINKWWCVRMAIATLNLNVLHKRMLNKTEAAEHCGRPLKRFEIECPVQAVCFQTETIDGTCTIWMRGSIA
jgi:hypothetical protein